MKEFLDRIVKIKEAAEVLGVSRRTLYRLIAEGKLPQPVRIGGRAGLFESDLREFMENLRKERGR